LYEENSPLVQETKVLVIAPALPALPPSLAVESTSQIQALTLQGSRVLDKGRSNFSSGIFAYDKNNRSALCHVTYMGKACSRQAIYISAIHGSQVGNAGIAGA
jgi:hypothetical protein